MKRKKTYKIYSPSERVDILKMANEVGVAKAANFHGCDEGTIYNWRKAGISPTPMTPVSKAVEAKEQPGTPVSNPWNKLVAENQRLKNIIINLMLESGKI